MREQWVEMMMMIEEVEEEVEEKLRLNDDEKEKGIDEWFGMTMTMVVVEVEVEEEKSGLIDVHSRWQTKQLSARQNLRWNPNYFRSPKQPDLLLAFSLQWTQSVLIEIVLQEEAYFSLPAEHTDVRSLVVAFQSSPFHSPFPILHRPDCLETQSVPTMRKCDRGSSFVVGLHLHGIFESPSLVGCQVH